MRLETNGVNGVNEGSSDHSDGGVEGMEEETGSSIRINTKCVFDYNECIGFRRQVGRGRIS